MASFVVFYDANVFYPAELRSFLMYLAVTRLFRAKWSASVHEQWISKLLQNRTDLTREKLERTRALIDLHVVDGLVTGYEHLIPGLLLPDPNDRHVLAAAIRGRADVIVTMNLKDFPRESLAPFGLEVQHPDEFILRLLDIAPGTVIGAAREHQQSMKNPPKSIPEYLDVLERHGLTQTVSALREYML